MLKNVKVLLFVVTVASLSAATVLLSDDFSNCANSNLNWAGAGGKVSATCGGGKYTLSNTDLSSSGLIKTTLASKPQTFTISVTTERANDNASVGFYFCLSQTSSGYNGYVFYVARNQFLQLSKIKGTGSVVLYADNSGWVRENRNDIQISRKNSTIVIACNGHYIATVEDSEFPSGDLGLLVPPSSSVIFDNVVVTDTPPLLEAPTCFTDDFNDGDLLGWLTFGNGTSALAGDGKMSVIPGDGKGTYPYVAFKPAANFVAKVAVSHRGGNSDALYGLVIKGTDDSIVPNVVFGITGNKNYLVSLPNVSAAPQTSTRIRGKAYKDETGTYYYTDTLEIVKKSSNPAYLFVVNGDTLTTFTGVNFIVDGVGVFALDGVEASFDNFFIGDPLKECNTSSSVRFPRYGKKSNITGKKVMYDPLGRIMQSSQSAPNGVLLYRDGNSIRKKIVIQ